MIRGKILRDTNSGPGVVVVDGVQKIFTLEDHWKSEIPAKVGAVVEVELTAEGGMVSVRAVDETVIAKEQAQKAIELAGEQGKKIAALAGSHGKVYAGVLVAKVGLPTLVAVGGLAISWLFLAALNIQVSSDNKASMTFFDILKIVNNSAGMDGFRGVEHLSSGFYGFLMLVALLAPIAPHFHDNKFLKLSYCLPLTFMIAIGLGIYWSIKSSMKDMGQTASAFGGSQASEMAQQMMASMMEMAMKAISVGFGTYIALAIAVYLASIGVKKFLVANA
jgi:hypothetical protein